LNVTLPFKLDAFAWPRGTARAQPKRCGEYAALEAGEGMAPGRQLSTEPGWCAICVNGTAFRSRDAVLLLGAGAPRGRRRAFARGGVARLVVSNRSPPTPNGSSRSSPRASCIPSSSRSMRRAGFDADREASGGTPTSACRRGRGFAAASLAYDLFYAATPTASYGRRVAPFAPILRRTRMLVEQGGRVVPRLALRSTADRPVYARCAKRCTARPVGACRRDDRKAGARRRRRRRVLRHVGGARRS